MSDFWRDMLALAGVGVTLIGFVIAFLQIRKTRTAADAAKLAAEESLSESRQHFQRYWSANAYRFFGNAKEHVGRQEWDHARRRLEDLAELAAQLVRMDSTWQPFAVKLREWAATLQKLAENRGRFTPQKWSRFCLEFMHHLDRSHSPFALMEESENDS